jgi:phytoene synthase
MTNAAVRPPGAALQPADVLGRSGSSFGTAFACLGQQRRESMTAIYAFCRVADDAVDDAPNAATARDHLQFWRDELAAAAASRAVTPVGQAVQGAMQRFGVDEKMLNALLDGVAMDLEPRGFADEAELLGYCEKVASAVGLACLPVLGAVEPAAEKFADALGKALQLTNILRDVRDDAAQGRIYAPRAWLEANGVDPAWLKGGGPETAYAAGGPVAKLCDQFVAAARREFALAQQALGELPQRSRRALVPARIMGAVYGRLLDRLAARGGRLSGKRIRIGTVGKLWQALLVGVGVRE